MSPRRNAETFSIAGLYEVNGTLVFFAFDSIRAAEHFIMVLTALVYDVSYRFAPMFRTAFVSLAKYIQCALVEVTPCQWMIRTLFYNGTELLYLFVKNAYLVFEFADPLFVA
ncbi:hypothetical protein ABT56_08570 [Photobacterium aquae]|uniref:Uncharacterized protein n=1 Tax=Photobacterium aquae TaxID=1195763 RepID=A0A0J1JVU7_9GAMM|nr:hypothetical protein [Photobacterium aquae]KLV06427.1 hypothetical protein ABT56_08570 [Photobacterium aquae]